MKRFVIFLIALGLLTKLYAQQDSLQKIDNKNGMNENSFPLPEFLKKPYFLEIKSNSLIELEKPRITSKAKLTGFGKAAAFAIVDNPSSPVKIKKTDVQNFIAKVSSGADPTTEFELVAFTVKKDKRQVKITEANGWNGTTKTVYETIPFQIKKLDEGAYLLIVKSLPPGEYFIATDGAYYAFSIE